MDWKEYFIAWDLETTGVNKDARIIEVGVAHFYRGKKVRVWSELVCPTGVMLDDPAYAEAQKIHKILPQLLYTASTFKKVSERMELEMSDIVWVGHNTLFDHRILGYEYGLLGREMKFSPQLIICTMYLDAFLCPNQKSYRLEESAARWKVPIVPTHRVTEDAEASGSILAAMLPKLPDSEKELGEVMKQGEREWRRRNRGK